LQGRNLQAETQRTKSGPSGPLFLAFISQTD
jgi:hypothetical protein